MKLKLKFNVGDTAYTIIGHKIHEVTIKSIKAVIVGIESHHRTIDYEFYGGPHGIGQEREENLYATKQELINSL